MMMNRETKSQYRNELYIGPSGRSSRLHQETDVVGAVRIHEVLRFDVRLVVREKEDRPAGRYSGGGGDRPPPARNPSSRGNAVTGNALMAVHKRVVDDRRRHVGVSAKCLTRDAVMRVAREDELNWRAIRRQSATAAMTAMTATHPLEGRRTVFLNMRSVRRCRGAGNMTGPLISADVIAKLQRRHDGQEGDSHTRFSTPSFLM